jgi:DNA-binding CsgD family transcriptional regulator
LARDLRGGLAVSNRIDVSGRRLSLMDRNAGATVIDWARLGAREREILACLAQDGVQKAIALKFGLSPSTVSGRVRSAVKRLGMRSAAEMVRAYYAWSEERTAPQCPPNRLGER